MSSVEEESLPEVCHCKMSWWWPRNSLAKVSTPVTLIVKSAGACRGL